MKFPGLCGVALPYAPGLQIVADAAYNWRLDDRLGSFVGAGITYNSATNASLGKLEQLRLTSYALLDMRAGIKALDDRWSLQVWGRNLTNSYYWSNALQSQDVYVRFTGKPVTYGLSFSIRYR